MGRTPVTSFDDELVDGIWWIAHGYRQRRVTKRVTTRLLRAALRRFNVLVTRESAAVATARSTDTPCRIREDHALPLREVVAQLLDHAGIDQVSLGPWLRDRLFLVALTHEEHDIMLKNAKLASRMPAGWDGTDLLARYTATGIVTLACAPRSAQTRRRRTRADH